MRGNWTRDKLIEYIKSRLGHPCIDLELEIEKKDGLGHLEIAIDDSLDWIFRHAQDEADYQDYVIVYTKTGQIEYKMPEGITDVIEGGRAWGNSITPWSTLNIGPGETLLSLSGSMNFDLPTFVAAKTLLSDAQKLIGLNYRFKFHKESGILRIIPTPREDVPIIVRVYREECFSEVFAMINFRNLVVATAREQIGIHLTKDDFNMPGGGRVNGDKILAKAEKDKKEAQDAIINESARPYLMTDLDL